MSQITLHQTNADDLSSEWLQVLLRRFGHRQGLDPSSACLVTLLDALGWRGGARQLVEALPVGTTFLDAADLRDTLARLGFKSDRLDVSTSKISDRLCPCLMFPKNGEPIVVLGRNVDGYEILDGAKPIRTERVKKLPNGLIFSIKAIADDNRLVNETPKHWLRRILGNVKGMLVSCLILSFFINVMSLLVPLSIMVIYDQVIAKESHDLLFTLMLGVGVATLFDIVLRLVRAWIQSSTGARLDYLISQRVFEHILHLPPLFTERAPVGGQVTRIREFASFRELFTGALTTLFLDMPFALIFLGVITALGGPLVFVPIVLAVVYFIIAYFAMPEIKSRTALSGEDRSKRHSYLVEIMWWMRSIKQLGGEKTWSERFRKISADASWANFEVARAQTVSQDVSQTLMILSGTATLVFGVFLAMAGQMTVGALIATMMLVWRVLSPIQTIFSLAGRAEQVRQSFGQLVRLLSYDKEQQPGDYPMTSIGFEGEIAFNRVSMRYSAESNPAVLGVNFTVEPGEMVGIIGHSGSGKTTLMKLALGLYRPQAGSVSIDGVDIRQLRPITLRQTISFVPQTNHSFPGTLLDNILISDPTASVERVRETCEMAGVLHKIEALPQGLLTPFREGVQAQVPQGFLRQLALARAFLRDSPILVMDEPASSMEDADERQFLSTISGLRGEKTILMITQRPSHMRLCDRLILLDHGAVVAIGTPDEVLSQPKSISDQATKAITS